MPGTPNQIVNPSLGPVWTPVLQAAQANKAKAAQLAAQAQQGNVYDQYMNTVEIAGSNLNQQVTIGASHGVGGVIVSTGLANGTAGRCVQQNLATGSITLSTASLNATVSTSGVFAVGMVIGAADAKGNAAIAPGTTIAGISGSTVTLSALPLESGSGLYCAAANFVQSEPGGWRTLTLSLPSGVSAASGYYTPAARLSAGDTVTLRGALLNSSGTTYTSSIVGTVAAAMIPAARAQPGNWSIDTSGNLRVISLAAGATVGLDGVSYSLF